MNSLSIESEAIEGVEASRIIAVLRIDDAAYTLAEANDTADSITLEDLTDFLAEWSVNAIKLGLDLHTSDDVQLLLDEIKNEVPVGK
jgi:hypothetical protein